MLNMKTDDINSEVSSRVLSILTDIHDNHNLLIGDLQGISLEPMAGDGSNRCFYRLQCHHFTCVAVSPGSTGAAGKREAGAAWYIGSHLRQKGVPVPEMFGYDASSGIILYEDLGSRHLYDIAAATDFSDRGMVAKLKTLYLDVLENLVLMQLKGGEGFQDGWCWDTPYYDRALMLEKESGYFMGAFWKNLLQQKDVKGLQQDFETLAGKASEQVADTYFLHRDFQSKNIMVKGGEVRFIDYQGGRKGPLGYDLASLLIDPYSLLPCWLQDELIEKYLDCLQGRITVDRESFKAAYLCLALQRNLQIVGAFSYLSRECGKIQFKKYLRPALVSLNKLLDKEGTPALPVLRHVASQSMQLLPDDYEP